MLTSVSFRVKVLFPTLIVLHIFCLPWFFIQFTFECYEWSWCFMHYLLDHNIWLHTNYFHSLVGIFFINYLKSVSFEYQPKIPADRTDEVTLDIPQKMLAGIITCDNVMCFDLISCSLPILHCFLLSLVPLCSQCLLWSSLAYFSRKPHGWIPSIAQRHAALAKAEAPGPGLHWVILLGISQCFTVREST